MPGEREFIARREVLEKRQVLGVVSRNVGLMVKACINYNCQASENAVEQNRASADFVPSESCYDTQRFSIPSGD